MGKSKSLRIFTLVLLFCCILGVVCAQPVDPPDPNNVPISGIEILLLLGGGLGLKKYLDRRNSKK